MIIGKKDFTSFSKVHTKPTQIFVKFIELSGIMKGK